MSRDNTEFAVTPSTATTLLEKCIESGRPVMLWGAPGIGKSDIIAQIGRRQNRPIIDMRLLIMEPTDIKGIPFYCPETNTMRWARPGELPGEDEIELHNAILFLDEITAAPQSVQAAAYQLVLNRRVGTYVLPDGVSILAAGNRETDRAVAHRMPSALKNRFVHFTLKHSYDDWEQWAIRAKIHPDIIGYLKGHPGNLFTFDPKSADNAFATPRTWEFVSQLYDPKNPESMNRQLVGGTVGNGLAIEFMSHCRLKGMLPNPNDILDGKVTELKDKDKVSTSALYSLVISMCYAMSERVDNAKSEGNDITSTEDWNEVSDRFLTFMMENMGTEMIIMGAIIALRTYELPIAVETDAFDVFYRKYNKYITK